MEYYSAKEVNCWDFPGDPVVKNPPANAGDMSSIMVREDATCHGTIKPVWHNY